MIKNKAELKEYIYKDNAYLHEIRDKKCSAIMKRVRDPEYLICKYLKLLRYQEYYINTAGNNKIKKLLALCYERKKHNIGNKLGFYIGPNSCESGLTIYHNGTIIINPQANIGKNCKFHGNNCIGNKGRSAGVPTLGNNVDIGFGAVIIGDVTLADNIIIGANSVVNKSFTTPGVTIAGVPAKVISETHNNGLPTANK